MLKNLDIENIAIIEKASVEFTPGLNVLTGETGAGKSIVIDSINAVTGEKTSRELIRTGAEHASVSAVFENISTVVEKKLEAAGITPEPDKTLLLQRKLYRDGKNRCTVNGNIVTVSMLKNIGMSLINIHGQRDSQELLDSEKHIDFVDSYAKADGLIEDYLNDYKRLLDIKAEIKALQMDDAMKERRLDMLKYQINELENANITVGEREGLQHKKSVLNNSAKLFSALSNALMCISGTDDGDGALALIDRARSGIESVSALAKGLDSLIDVLINSRELAESAADALDDVLSQLSAVDGDIDEIEDRLDVLYRLSKKYGDSEEEMLEFLRSAKAEYSGIESSEERLSQFEKEYEILYKTALDKAEHISEIRHLTAERLSEEIVRELAFLDMPSCRFSVNISKIPLCERGCDAVEFLISANAGEEPKPLGKVASGGELSRIMLAMKNVFSEIDNIDTLIFDEIDTGVSGNAAHKIAVKLKSVSKNAQVLCITHQSQIAAFADEHKYLYKEVSDNKTYTRIKTLSEKEREYELARITFGNDIGEVELSSAKKMIENAKK